MFLFGLIVGVALSGGAVYAWHKYVGDAVKLPW